MSDSDLIRVAIQRKQHVIATYNGYSRELCPHVLGYKNGALQCLFYQFGGHSSSGSITPGSPANWRCMPLANLKDIRVVDGPWHTAANHSRPQTCVDSVVEEVTP